MAHDESESRMPPKAPNKAAAQTETLGNYDARSGGSAVRRVLQTWALNLSAKPSPGIKALRKAVGTQGIVEVDPLTGRPRQVARLDGFLTG